jgi:catechol-2,3-dioxygenase
LRSSVEVVARAPRDENSTDRLPLTVDWRLELVQVPVSDVDRAKAFYTDKAGFNAETMTTGSATRSASSS